MTNATSQTSLSDLIARATAGRRLDRKRDLRASLLYQLITDPHWVWCHLHAPRSAAVEEESAYDRAKMQRGIAYEESFVREQFPGAVKVEPEWGYPALARTLKLMLDGAAAIYQPQLWSLGDDLYGKGDLLVRVNGQPSDLGDYSYSVIEIKRSSNLKPYQAAQAAAYHKMVSKIQGRTLDTFSIALPSGVRQVAYADQVVPLDDAIALWRKIAAKAVEPEPRGWGKTGSPWTDWSNEQLTARMDLTLLPGVGPAARDDIRRRLGANAITDLFGRPLADFTATMGPEVGRRLYYSVEAYRVRGPVVEPNRQVVIPRGVRSFGFDTETTDDVGPPHVQPPHCWLSGVWDFQTGGTFQFIARGPGEEAGMLTRLMDHIGDSASACVLCWTLYEVGVLEGAAQRHPQLAPRLLALASACVDLKEVVKQQVYLPVPNYSIKQVAPALGFHWRHKGYGAFAAMTDYWRWVGGEEAPIMQLGLNYHEDDLIAMERIVRALDGLQGPSPTP